MPHKRRLTAPGKLMKAFDEFYNSVGNNKILNSETTLLDSNGYSYGNRLLSVNGALPWRGQGTWNHRGRVNNPSAEQVSLCGDAKDLCSQCCDS